jgi:hypothetical protein
MPDQLLQRPILPELFEILQALAPGGLSAIRSFLHTSSSKPRWRSLIAGVPVGAFSQAQTSERFHHQRQSCKSGDQILGRFRIDIEQHRSFAGKVKTPVLATPLPA